MTRMAAAMAFLGALPCTMCDNPTECRLREQPLCSECYDDVTKLLHAAAYVRALENQ